MFTRWFAGLAILFGTLALGSSLIPTRPNQMDCCEQGLECCFYDLECCQTTAKKTCCATASECCSRVEACCETK